MKYLIVAVSLFCCVVTEAASTFQVDTWSFEQGEDVKMPLLSGGSVKIANKINDALFLAQFGVAMPSHRGASFGAADGIALNGLSSQEFSVLRNDSRLLVIDFETERCGAYCENHHELYSFDATTGRFIQPETLFSAQGRRYIGGKLGKKRTLLYRKQLTELNQQLKDLTKSKNTSAQQDGDDLQERIDLNRQCLGEFDEPNAQAIPDAPATTDSQVSIGNTIEIGNSAIDFIAERCSNHAMRALDDVGEVTLSLPIVKLKPYLTAYGRFLLLNEANVAPRDDLFDLILRGHLGGKTKISMTLSRGDDNTVTGSYFYDKFRQPIAISGTIKGNDIDLDEKVGETEAVKAKIHLLVSGNRLVGTWAGDQQLEMELAP